MARPPTQVPIRRRQTGSDPVRVVGPDDPTGGSPHVFGRLLSRRSRAGSDVTLLLAVSQTSFHVQSPESAPTGVRLRGPESAIWR